MSSFFVIAAAVLVFKLIGMLIDRYPYIIIGIMVGRLLVDYYYGVAMPDDIWYCVVASVIVYGLSRRWV